MEMVKLVQPYEEKHSEDVETDVFTYVYGDLPKILEDEITLPNHDTLTKLALSHGIAQSVKLGTFENSLKLLLTNRKIFLKTLPSKEKFHYQKMLSQENGQAFLQEIPSTYMQMFWMFRNSFGNIRS